MEREEVLKLLLGSCDCFVDPVVKGCPMNNEGLNDCKLCADLYLQEYEKKIKKKMLLNLVEKFEIKYKKVEDGIEEFERIHPMDHRAMKAPKARLATINETIEIIRREIDNL